jgi:fructokinase
MKKMNLPSIVCFGEVLWDLLPTGPVAGGAPMNVAFHTHQLGMKSTIISKVGNDQLGGSLTQLLKEKGISTSLIQQDYTFATGTVNVSLDEHGSPEYEIVSPVAWDYIHADNKAKDIIQASDALIFGSLACRTDCNKKTLLSYLPLASIRIFDVNLRQSFFSQALIEELLLQADIVKVNHEELDLIAKWNGFTGNDESRLAQLRKKFGIDVLLLTRGDKGAACLYEQGFFQHAGFPVQVEDTIGSGDAFLATFTASLLNGESYDVCLKKATGAGAYVASQRGATPSFSSKTLADFMATSQTTQ